MVHRVLCALLLQVVSIGAVFWETPGFQALKAAASKHRDQESNIDGNENNVTVNESPEQARVRESVRVARILQPDVSAEFLPERPDQKGGAWDFSSDS
mmetsp:Transcript_28944/g.76357  ORF Transcript_28944/g.76357 Transcript_28944/m.76357 type:complete len:98 (+) Transcript_28944:53-346(+)